MAPRESARKQKTRDIRACDQEHRRDRTEKYVQGLSKIAANVIEQQANLDADRIAILRVLLRETSLYRIHFRSRLRHTDIRLEPPNHLDSPVGTFGRQTNGFLLRDRKSTRLNSSHRCISYAVFCLKKKTRKHTQF